ncbi:hypothetical protein PF003_g9895 [Phytophthora fragariae]|nr:hypothetical protein PF003_g9895 [Phytophthora fragariae]
MMRRVHRRSRRIAWWSGRTTEKQDESILTGDDYKKIATLSLVELQGCFREKIKKRWTYVHTNAIGIAFMLDPATDLDDFVGTDSEKVDDQVCQMAYYLLFMSSSTSVPSLAVRTAVSA